MAQVELVCAHKLSGVAYVDLFCKVSNKRAIDFYRKVEFVTYRTIARYYEDGKDALDMRKSLPADIEQRCMRPQRPPTNLSEWARRRDAREAARASGINL
jgi:hypothetical protein